MKRLLLVVALAIGAVACAGDEKSDPVASPNALAVTATMDAIRAALAAGDVAGFMQWWTDDALEEVFHESGDAFVGNTGYYLGAKQWGLGAISDPVIVGDTATTVASLFFRLVGPARDFTLVKVDGAWLIDGAALTTADTGDALVVDVEFGDSSIEFNSSLIVDGNIAVQIHNGTSQRHELNILTAPPDQDITVFFEHPEDAPPVPEGKSMPEGFDFIGGVNGIEPGATVTLLFLNPLPSARYVMFCNTETVPGEPHSQSAEFAEFTIA